ncbi:MAG: transposase, partial [Patescibacteria group bacterium]|nr:transposase [Patescibacteria group bacterium]MDD5173003.1 transposase [Patescibacteria group bacterium]
MANLNFFTGGYYHIFNRGVEKRNIFLEEGDFLRFVHYLYILNDDQPLSAEFRQRTKLTYEVSPRRLTPRRLNRKRLVDILAFCLMPNHYHLFVEQKIENGISKFMQKLGTAESMFFNAKY